MAMHHAIKKIEKPLLDRIQHLTNHIPIIILSLSFAVLFRSFYPINNLRLATPALRSSK
jgi:hypothetical protein